MADASLTPRTRRLLALAQDISRRGRTAGCDRSDLAMLIAILEDDGGIAAAILRPLGLSLGKLYDELPWQPGANPPVVRRDDQADDEVARLLRAAAAIRQELGGAAIGSEHFLLAMVRSPDSAAGKALAKAGITERILEESANRIESL
jgi:ATP-dependent Clp protease ATP-binding subunit ClpA